MLARREWEGVSKDPDRDAGSRFGGHAELSLPAAALPRQLLHNPVAGTGIEGEAVLATERGTAQRDGQGRMLISDDDVLGGLLGRAVPAIDRFSGEDAVVVNNELGWHVRQERLHLRQLAEEPIRRIFNDERAARVDGANVPNGIKETGVEDVRQRPS